MKEAIFEEDIQKVKLFWVFLIYFYFYFTNVGCTTITYGLEKRFEFFLDCTFICICTSVWVWVLELECNWGQPRRKMRIGNTRAT
ncbi:hypothetical protein DL95DRAFT_384522 [Leptodontidium sp. 2 PMI_412]|nr:hypothetical protein DL95DRAFT_384522 [Leptodontidium sp. 2 PMI_412]